MWSSLAKFWSSPRPSLDLAELSPELAESDFNSVEPDRSRKDFRPEVQGDPRGQHTRQCTRTRIGKADTDRLA